MLVPIVQDMATLAERLEVSRFAVAWIVVEVGARQVHAGDLHQHAGWQALQRRQLEPAAPAIAPDTSLRVPPASITQMRD